MPVSAKTATKLREAMARLLAGEPLHTDRALTKDSPARPRSAMRLSTAPTTSSPNGMPRFPARSCGHRAKSAGTRTSAPSVDNSARLNTRSQS